MEKRDISEKRNIREKREKKREKKDVPKMYQRRYWQKCSKLQIYWQKCSKSEKVGGPVKAHHHYKSSSWS